MVFSRMVRFVAVFAALAAGMAGIDGTARATTAVSCPTVASGTGVVTPAPSPGVDWSGCGLVSANLVDADLADANLAGANLANAELAGADFTSATLTRANLTNANVSAVIMSGTDFTGANLKSIRSYEGGSGTPAALPVHWKAVDGFLFGPTTVIDETGIPADADLSGADLDHASIQEVDMPGVNLDRANLSYADFSGDIWTGAKVVGATWWHTHCADYTSSDQRVHGCFSPLDTTPPSVTLTGVTEGHKYVYGGFTARCRTTDNGTVAKPAALEVFGPQIEGVWFYDDSCAGATDLAGNRQRKNPQVHFIAVYGMNGFLAPAKGSTVARSQHTINVRFRLANANGTSAPAAAQADIGTAFMVAMLRGPGLSKAVVGNCKWKSAGRYISCLVPIPGGVRTGARWKYTIAPEEVIDSGYQVVPGVRGAVDPEVIHFR